MTKLLRVLHTSDWHLGQTFKGFDRHAEHRCFLLWLTETLLERRIDALLIAGDVFDQANPGAAAQGLLYDFVAAARQRCPGLEIVIIAGNHDSPARIDAPHPVLRSLGVRVVGHWNARSPLDQAQLERLIVPLHNAQGQQRAQVLAVPFLRPADVGSQGEGYPAAIAEAYARLAEAARARVDDDQALLLMGHLHVRGGDMSPDSERRLVIGGEEALDSSVFPSASYVALGHLHKLQQAGGAHIRYCGSPLPLSFSEINYPHQVLEVLLDGATLQSVEAIRVPRPAAMLRIPPSPQPLPEVLSALSALQVEATEPGLEPLLEVMLEADLVPTDLRAQIEQALEGKSVRLTGVVRSYPQRRGESADTQSEPRLKLTDLSPEHLFTRLLDEELPDQDHTALLQAFAELLDSLRQQESRS